MATVVIHHSTTTGADPNPDALVDGPAWDAAHTVTGLENVPNVDTTNASNLTSGTMARPFSQTQALTGTGTAVVPANLIELSDNVAITESDTDYKGRYTPEGWYNVNGLTVNWETGSAGTFTGARTPILGNLFLSHASSPSNAANFYAAGILTANIYVDDNGTAPTPKGVSYGLATVTYQKSAVKHWGSMYGIEVDMIAEATSATNLKVGVASYSSGPTGLKLGDAVQGTTYDAAFLAGAPGGGVGWKYGYAVGVFTGGDQPVGTTGTLFGTFGSFTADKAIDVSSATITSYLLKSSSVNITGQGAYSVTTGALTGDAAVINMLSGNATQHIYTAMGRTANTDLIFGVAGNAGDFVTGTASGDAVIKYGSKLWLGPILNITSTGTISTTTGTLSGDPAVINLLSGNNAQHIYTAMGRTSNADFISGVAGAVNDFVTGSASGDAVIKYANNFWLGANVKVTSAGLVNLSNLTASSAVATDASKNLVSITNTGTGNNVLATSPTLTSPNIGAATGASLNLSGLTASAALATDGSKNLVSVTNTGSGNNVLATTPTITNPNIVGTTTNDSAAAGSVGEYVSSTVISSSAVALTTATAANVTSISLTAGDWDVSGLVAFLPANTTSLTQIVGSISTTSATLNTAPGNLVSLVFPATVYDGATQTNCPMPPVRVSIASTTTVYLVAMAKFTVSTNGAFGLIRARRVR